MRQALNEAELHGIEHNHEHNRNGRSFRFQDEGCLRSRGDEHIGAKSNQLGGQSWYAIRRLGKTIDDNQVFSIYPAVVSQPIKQR
jgi:hypothetical protein